MQRKIKMTFLLAASVSILMFAFSFALSPLYRVFCKVTGLSTSINIAASKEEITLQFVTTNNANIPWEFYPEKNTLKLHLGELGKMLFYAKNNSSHTITVQAIPSYSPALAAKYFHKLECFCFTQQTLAAGESKALPVYFQIDKTIPANIQVITLAYTLFAVKRISA